MAKRQWKKLFLKKLKHLLVLPLFSISNTLNPNKFEDSFIFVNVESVQNAFSFKFLDAANKKPLE